MATPKRTSDNSQYVTSFTLDRRLEGVSARTLKEDARVLGTVPYVLPGTVQEARSWLADRADAVGMATIHRHVCSLKAFGRWWAEENKVADPMETLKYPKVPEARPGKIAEDADLEKALAVLGPYSEHEHRNNYRDHAILSLLAYTGMRRSEAAKLSLDDVDLERGVIIVQDTKNNDSRVVPVHAKLAQSLHRYLKRGRPSYPLHTTTNALFIGRDGALRDDSITRVFVRINKEAGTTLSPHQFRRRLAKVWVQSGGSDDALQMVAGWRDGTMPGRYRKAYRAELAREQYATIFGDPQPEPVKRGPRTIKRKLPTALSEQEGTSVR